MMICCCSLAGTAACKTCNNNPNAEKNIYTYEYISYPNEIHINTKVKPVKQYWCNNCDALLTIYQKYCHNCGKEIDWSNEEKE